MFADYYSRHWVLIAGWAFAKEWTECFPEFAIENTVNDDIHRTVDNGKDPGCGM